MVPSGTVRPSRSGPLVPLWPVIKSLKSVNPLARWAAVGTVTSHGFAWRILVPS